MSTTYRITYLWEGSRMQCITHAKDPDAWQRVWPRHVLVDLEEVPISSVV